MKLILQSNNSNGACVLRDATSSQTCKKSGTCSLTFLEQNLDIFQKSKLNGHKL